MFSPIPTQETFLSSIKHYRPEVFRIWLHRLFVDGHGHGYDLHQLYREPLPGAPKMDHTAFAADHVLRLATGAGWIIRAKLRALPEQEVLMADLNPAWFGHSVYEYGPNLVCKEAAAFAYGQPATENTSEMFDALLESLNAMLRLGDLQDLQMAQNFSAMFQIPMEEVPAKMAEIQEEGRQAQAASLALRKSAPRAPKGQNRPVSASKGKNLGNGEQELTQRQKDLLSFVSVRDNTAFFDSSERIPDWKELKYVLTTLGGEWKSKIQGFVFPPDIEASARIQLAQENGSIKDPRTMDLYETPDPLAVWVVAQAKLRPGLSVLEPSAGYGSLVAAMHSRYAGESIKWHINELNPDVYAKLCTRFAGLPDFTKTNMDFLTMDGQYDRIVMNPPFSFPTRHSDCDHVSHAIDLLRPKGRLVAIMGSGQYTSTDSKAQEFHAKVERFAHRWYENPEGSFLASGTAVRTMTLVLNKVEA